MIDLETLKSAISDTLKSGNQHLSTREIARRLLNAQRYTGILQEDLQKEILLCIDQYHQAFIKFEQDLIGLNDLHAQQTHAQLIEKNENFDPKIIQYPTHSKISHLLKIINDTPYLLIKNLLRALKAITKNQILQIDQPLKWMSEHLKHKNLDLAKTIYLKSEQSIDPMELFSLFQFCFLHELLRLENDQKVIITQRGDLWIDHPFGQVVQEIDIKEGLFWILMQLAEKGAVAYAQLLDFWINEDQKMHMQAQNFQKKQLEDMLKDRLKHLLDRALMTKNYQQQYALSEKGLIYLRDFQISHSQSEQEMKQLWSLIENQKLQTRKALFEHLAQMNPLSFEVLIAHLLEAMGYEEIEITKSSHDQGIDVVGQIQIGISAIKEVIQVKRNQHHVDRPVLDALRGSLHRFKAVRGTLVALGGFSQGTIEAAFETGVAPITLIDGEKLLDLLMSYEIGVKQKKITLWQLELSDFDRLSKKNFIIKT
jgi:restriction system protein